MVQETELVATQPHPTTTTTSTQRLQDVEAQEEPETEDKKWRDMERSLTTRIVQGTAGASIVLNILAMAIEGGAALGMGIIALLVASVVIFFQFMIQDIDTLRQVQNELRHSVNDFADANVELGLNTTRMEQELIPLKETEAKLETIAAKSGSNAAKLRDLVKDNQTTLDQMNAALKEDVIQDMMEVVLQAEQDENGKFSDQELKRLLLRLKGLPSIEIDGERFLKRAQQHRSMSDVFGVLKTIYDDDIPQEEQIISISAKPEAMVSRDLASTSILCGL